VSPRYIIRTRHEQPAASNPFPPSVFICLFDVLSARRRPDVKRLGVRDINRNTERTSGVFSYFQTILDVLRVVCVFFFNGAATTEIYTLSLHAALPIFFRFSQFFRERLASLPPSRHPDSPFTTRFGIYLGTGTNDKRANLRRPYFSTSGRRRRDSCIPNARLYIYIYIYGIITVARDALRLFPKKMSSALVRVCRRGGCDRTIGET